MFSIKTHSFLDYFFSLFLVMCPLLFGFSNDLPVARNVFVTIGFVMFFYSVVTDYLHSLVKWIPVPVHLALDLCAGLALFIAPSVFNYRTAMNSGLTLLHLVSGLMSIALVVFTRPAASEEPGAEELEFPEDWKKAA